MSYNCHQTGLVLIGNKRIPGWAIGFALVATIVSNITFFVNAGDAGASISLLKLDDELIRLLSKPASSPFFEQVQVLTDSF